jgi:dynein heavy chain
MLPRRTMQAACHSTNPSPYPRAQTLRISEELLPTRAKSHYTFNMRDLSKLMQGLLLASPRAAASRDAVARLWLHEACRVFHDRLTCEGDRGAFKKMLVSGL